MPLTRRLVFALLLLAPSVAAAPAAPKKEVAPALPAPDLKLTVEPRPAKPWKVTVSNTGSVPLRIVADVRLLRLSIEAPPSTTPLKKGEKAPAATECALPGSMRSDERTLILAPGAKWSDEVDVRLFCLDRVDRLVDGAIVTPRYGWAAPKTGKLAAPFVVVPESTEVASAKELAAGAIVLDASQFTTPANGSQGPITAIPGGARSNGSGKDAEATIVLRNISKETKTLYPRPQLVDARVVNPQGQLVSCAGAAITPAPIAEFVTKLGPNATWQATVPLASLCPSGTFDRPGLYFVTPVIHLPPMPDTPKAVTGEIAAERVQLLRIETAPKPFYDAPPKADKT